MDHRRLLPALFAIALLAPLLTGCIRLYWSKPGTTPEDFARDSQDCAQEGTAAGPGKIAMTRYRSCLAARGYLREQQADPPPPGSYRGIEDEEQFVVIQRAPTAPPPAGAPSGSTLEQQLAGLDDLKARGRISEEEYAVVRRRIIEEATPASVVAAPPHVTGTALAPAAIAGRWRRAGPAGGTLEISGQVPGAMQWTWELPSSSSPYRAGGQGEVKGGVILLTGFVTAGSPAAVPQAFTFELRMVGDRLTGTGYPPDGSPFAVEFLRDPL